MGEQHLDLLAQFAGDRVFRGPGDRTGPIAGWLVDRSKHVTGRFPRAAVRFQVTDIAVGLAGPVAQHPILIWFLLPGFRKCSAVLLQLLAARTGVDVLLGIIGKFGAFERAVPARRLVKHWYMRRDPALLIQLVQHLARAVGGVGDQPFWPEAEAVAHPVNHRPHRSDFGLADRTGGLDIKDHAVVGIDQVIGGIGEIGRSTPRSGPLRCGIGMRGELRFNRAGRAEGRIIERGQVFPDRPQRLLGIDLVRLPIGLG